MYQIEFECQAFFLHAAENPESVENPETVEKAESGQNAESEEFRRPLKIEKRGKPEIVENADTTVKIRAKAGSLLHRTLGPFVLFPIISAC